MQETKSSPKDRVFTLPSISEDEEVSETDDESKSREKRDDDDDDDSQSSHVMSPSTSVNSPLLANHKPIKLPNGDIEVFNRYST